MTVLDCLPKALTLSAVGNDGRIITKEVCRCLLTAIAKIGLSYETGGGGTLLNVKCPARPGTHRKTNARGLPRGDARGWN